ncbi:MAG: HAD family hydrolase, partial [Planctomycetaceae bacterium]|nr:HAD family hydrolase [Planctomycetaceae bacterium]
MRARSIPQIRVVAFDAVGTLIYAEPSVTAAYRTAITRHGAPDPGQDEVRRIVAASLSARSRGADLSTSEEQEVAFWRQLVEQFFSRPDTAAACFQELWDHFADARNWRCFDDVSATLDSLQERNIPVAVASNFDSRLNPVCNGLNELRTLGARFISSEVGFRKPDPQFFRRIAEH